MTTHTPRQAPGMLYKGCLNKRYYHTEDRARTHAVEFLPFAYQKGKELWVYKCAACAGYHLTSNGGPKDRKIELPSQYTPPQPEPEPKRMPQHPELKPIKSSMMSAYAYDPASRDMHIQFRNGDVWHYRDVPMDKAEAFSGAASPGLFFTDKIRGNHMGTKL